MKISEFKKLIDDAYVKILQHSYKSGSGDIPLEPEIYVVDRFDDLADPELFIESSDQDGLKILIVQP